MGFQNHVSFKFMHKLVSIGVDCNYCTVSFPLQFIQFFFGYLYERQCVQESRRGQSPAACTGSRRFSCHVVLSSVRRRIPPVAEGEDVPKGTARRHGRQSGSPYVLHSFTALDRIFQRQNPREAGICLTSVFSGSWFQPFSKTANRGS